MFHRYENTNFLCFNMLQDEGSILYQVFSHTNIAVYILELTADVRHQEICTNHTHKKCLYETHTNGIIQNCSKPPHYSLIFSYVSLLP